MGWFKELFEELFVTKVIDVDEYTRQQDANRVYAAMARRGASHDQANAIANKAARPTWWRECKKK